MAKIVYQLPLQPRPLDFQVRIPSTGLTYRFLTQFRDEYEAGWLLDLDSIDTGERIVHGISLVSGLDLLWQYNYLGLEFYLMLICRGGRTTPTYESLGVEDTLVMAMKEDVDRRPIMVKLTGVPLVPVEIQPEP